MGIAILAAGLPLWFETAAKRVPLWPRARLPVCAGELMRDAGGAVVWPGRWPMR